MALNLLAATTRPLFSGAGSLRQPAEGQDVALFFSLICSTGFASSNFAARGWCAGVFRKVRALGFEPPEITHMDSVTFLDIVAFNQNFPSALYFMPWCTRCRLMFSDFAAMPNCGCTASSRPGPLYRPSRSACVLVVVQIPAPGVRKVFGRGRASSAG